MLRSQRQKFWKGQSWESEILGRLESEILERSESNILPLTLQPWLWLNSLNFFCYFKKDLDMTEKKQVGKHLSDLKNSQNIAVLQSIGLDQLFPKWQACRHGQLGVIGDPANN